MGQRQQQKITFTGAEYTNAAARLTRMNYVQVEHQATDAAEKDSVSLASQDNDSSQISFIETSKPASRAMRLENALPLAAVTGIIFAVAACNQSPKGSKRAGLGGRAQSDGRQPRREQREALPAGVAADPRREPARGPRV